MVLNLNGSLVPAAEGRIAALDHGLLYGDGLFETLRVYEGRFFRLEAHLERLRRSAAQIGLPVPWTDSDLREALVATAGANGFGDGVLRLTVTRGAGEPVPGFPACGPPAYLITARPWSPRPGAGVSVCFAGRHPQTTVPGIKSLSYLPFLLARSEARQRGFDEALLCAGEEVVEASTSSLFAVLQGRLFTPPLDSGCLPGVTRAVVLEIAARALVLREQEMIRPLCKQDLLEADELFLTNSVTGIQPVSRLESRTLPRCPGTLTAALDRLYRELVEIELRA